MAGVGKLVGKPDAYWLKANTKLARGKQGALCVAVHLPTKSHTHHPVSNGGVFVEKLVICAN